MTTNLACYDISIYMMYMHIMYYLYYIHAHDGDYLIYYKINAQNISPFAAYRPSATSFYSHLVFNIPLIIISNCHKTQA